MIHEKAATGFDRAGDEYHKGRPDYPREAIDFMVVYGRTISTDIQNQDR